MTTKLDISKFVDAQESKRLHPETFNTPSLKKLFAIRPGDMVKVCYRRDTFWTKVVSVKGLRVNAEVRNSMLTLPGIRLNDEITFSLYHIFEIIKEK